MSNSEQPERLGLLKVMFRDGGIQTVSNVSAKEAGTLLDHLSKMMADDVPAPRFAAIRRPENSYAVDLSQVRSVEFALFADEPADAGAVSA